MVEFALVAVLLIMVLLSVVEMTRLILVYTTMAHAARAGVRYAMVHGGERTGSGSTGPSGPTSGTSCTCAEVQTVVNNYAAAGLLDTSNLTTTVTYPDSSNAAGSAVQVTVQYTYDPLIAYFRPSLVTTLSSTSEGVITF
ncbi:MAG TPA: TadE/TadG family type IV pilus assembly protein [Acidobacteriaceae bacterium]|nr:TadE/TadG family type IV pilus assembly protein [Acidobacteriaceae bacterium]